VWGSEFTSKDATLQGDPAESAAGLNAKFWDSVTAWSRATPTILLNDSSQHVRLGFCTSRRAARWGNARHRPKHAATRLPPVGPPEAHAVFFCRRRQRYKHASVVERPPHSYGQRPELAEGSSAQGLTCHCTDKAVYMYSSPLQICCVALLLQG
jgi:hypothetical protein